MKNDLPDNSSIEIPLLESKGSKNLLEADTGRYEVCTGISSKLHDVDRDMHVLQLDIDSIEADKPLDRISDYIHDHAPTGTYLVFKNGPDSYNVTSLNVFTWQETIQHKANCSMDDADHLKISINRGHSILRLSGKGERPRPDLKAVIHSEPEISEHPAQGSSETHGLRYSKPHVALYDKLYADYGLRSLMPAGVYVEGSVQREKYLTRCSK